ncbi:hypothetical protein UFOVP1047_2 [uncultured Caudovirales phage]|uniref:Uncharacterized protein n=4 Tax=uncultured Caudovirales phage TaxID=2100421 RepID=A0A6J5QFX5_9CAUD|nr:hypothetical protein UFOVP1047_2 [uncultured Caudovirales phage]
MPNEQITVPLFTAGEVLTAANMNLSAGTGVPVFTNTTTRDAAFGGTGEKVLAEGQLCYLSSTNVVQYYDGAAWATVGPSTASGLNFIKSQVIGSGVQTVTVTNAFSTTYDDYRIVVSNTTLSGGGILYMTINGSAGSTYGSSGYSMSYTTSTLTGDFTGATSAQGFGLAGALGTSSSTFTVDIFSPFLATTTQTVSRYASNTVQSVWGGHDSNTSSSTNFTLDINSTFTFTGGTIYVYGYAKA